MAKIGIEHNCKICGHVLTTKEVKGEGLVPYCEQCGELRFPMFNVGMSAIVYDPTGEYIVLIQQYGSQAYRLVAGYTNLGEDIEDTLVREVKEELGLNVTDFKFNLSHYFEPSNTLMFNFACKVDSDDLTKINEEVDAIRWFTPEAAERILMEKVNESNLAKKFLLHWFEKNGKTY